MLGSRSRVSVLEAKIGEKKSHNDKTADDAFENRPVQPITWRS